MSGKRNPRIGADILDDVSDAGEPEAVRDERERPGNDNISPAFVEEWIVDPFMHEASLLGPEVLAPLLLDMDQRPLPPAEPEVLDARQQEKSSSAYRFPLITFR